MWLPVLIVSWMIVTWPGGVSGEVYSWTDENGATHFSDTAPADRQSKRLKTQEDCPLRGQIVELQLGARANLGLWLYLGAPMQTDGPTTQRYGNSQRWPIDRWQYQQWSEDQKIKEIKNKIIFEARQCAAGSRQACACSRSLFHDPPRGFAPNGYIPPSETQLKGLNGHLAERGMAPP